MPFRPADSGFRKSSYPPEDTHQEAAYLRSLGEKQKPVRVKLMDGEVVRGWIEYYDRRMIRLTRDGAPNLFIYKHDIAYIAEEGGKPRRTIRSASDGALTPGIADFNE
jgi:host factor-I protein